MAFQIRTNMMAARALREYGVKTDALDGTTQRLASGKRINEAKDDAAGMSISENLRADVRSLAVAKRNALDALSFTEIAEGGFVEASNVLVRLRELAVQAGSDTVGPEERGYLDREFVQLKLEIDRIASSVEFNGVKLVAGFPDGPRGSQQGLPTRAIDYPMEFQIDNDYYTKSDAAAAKNPVDIIRFDSRDMVAYTSGDHSLNLGEGDEGVRLRSKVQAHESIHRIDEAQKVLATHRATAGALQARLKDTMANLGVQIENLMQANSRILDADFAKEIAEYTQNNILRQGTNAILSQANQQPKQALALLQSDNRIPNILVQTLIPRSIV